MKLSASVANLRGIGPKLKEKMEKRGIETLEDLLLELPYRYEDETQIGSFASPNFQEKMTYVATVVGKSPLRKRQGNMWMQVFTLEDRTTTAEMTLFNQPYMDRTLKVGDSIHIYGKANLFKNKLQFPSPKVTKSSKAEGMSIRPIYSMGEGIKSFKMEQFIEQALVVADIEETLPAYLLERYGLMGRREAFQRIHQPKTMEDVVQARNRLIFEEFFYFQLAVKDLARGEKEEGYLLPKSDSWEKIEMTLPFSLTEGQRKVLIDMDRDFTSGHAMYRLIQGDVGSGKTVVALLAAARAVENGYQALMMAPTEILAKQHYLEAIRLLEPFGARVEFLSGSTSEKRRREILENVEMGLVDILIGTHALVEESVQLPNLGLTIIDEQHRFGVDQRKKLQEKDERAHHLFLTATPIPRTLGMVLFADMDQSTIDTVPSNRKTIQTSAIDQSKLASAFRFIGRELEAGHQVYVVCPLIEENEALELDSAESVYENLQHNIYPNHKVGLLHGQMNNEEKDQIMKKFSAGEIQILVATTVIEVGVNVPNATVLLVYNADRFGLATLHQLRGRVGRGEHQSYAILFSRSESEIAWQRLNTVVSSTDGFYIAEKDLELRGSGDFFGTRQSGYGNFKIANPILDRDILHYASIEAEAIVSGGHLNLKEQPLLYRRVKEFSH